MTPQGQARPGLIARLIGDDGAILRSAFYLLLGGTMSVLYLDFKELMANDAATAALSAPSVPLLPAFDPASPGSSGPSLSTDRALLEAPLTVTLAGGGVLALTGTIDPGAADRVAAEIAARGEYVTTVALDSPGGSVTDALAIGRLLREHGYTTSVAAGALCASSCPLVLAGGASRFAAVGAAIGVHQIYAAVSPADLPTGARAAGYGMSEAQALTATVSRYLSEMGIDPALWLHALETPPGDLYFLSPQELGDYRLVTGPAPATS